MAAGATAGMTTCLTKVSMGNPARGSVLGGGPSPPPAELASVDAEVRATVLGPALLAGLPARRALLAVADDRDATRRDALRHEEVARRPRAALTQGQVVLVGATLVGVALDQDQVLRVGLEPARVHFEDLGGFRKDVRPIELEVDVLEVRHRVVRGRRRPHGAALVARHPAPTPGAVAAGTAGTTGAPIRATSSSLARRRTPLRVLTQSRQLGAASDTKQKHQQREGDDLPAPCLHCFFLLCPGRACGRFGLGPGSAQR